MNSSAHSSRLSDGSGQLVTPPDIVDAPDRLTNAFSARMTLAPISAARNAAQMPPKPPPTISTSVSTMFTGRIASSWRPHCVLIALPRSLRLDAGRLDDRRPPIALGARDGGHFGRGAAD